MSPSSLHTPLHTSKANLVPHKFQHAYRRTPLYHNCRGFFRRLEFNALNPPARYRLSEISANFFLPESLWNKRRCQCAFRTNSCRTALIDESPAPAAAPNFTTVRPSESLHVQFLSRTCIPPTCLGARSCDALLAHLSHVWSAWAHFPKPSSLL